MFGMGLGEILLIAVIAVIFLGPEKLPEAMIKTAKFLRSVKKGLSEAKNTLDQEINLSELKSDALEYNRKLTQQTQAIINEPELDETRREVRDLFSDLAKTSSEIKEQTKVE
ncbi:MAG: Sec-independent protein translocase protein TatB [Helicobacteraceae bacterium]|jgi:sec-independent protein translocase protein TatB|nr:Sec-independent protein translocase protein TatB [Helicobacteraceae bacterium]